MKNIFSFKNKKFSSYKNILNKKRNFALKLLVLSELGYTQPQTYRILAYENFLQSTLR